MLSDRVHPKETVVILSPNSTEHPEYVHESCSCSTLIAVFHCTLFLLLAVLVIVLCVFVTLNSQLDTRINDHVAITSNQ